MFCCLVLDSSAPPGVLAEVARACSPRVELSGDRVAVFDARGLERVIGPPGVVAEEVRRLAADRGLSARIALAATATAARLLAQTRPGVTVATVRREIDSVKIEDVGCLFEGDDGQKDARRLVETAIRTFRRWGLRTCGEVARLPRAEVAARLGALGVAFHQAASGEDAAPIVPLLDERRFVERLELEWPLEGLEALSFVLARLCDAHAAALERADRGAVAVTTRLTLVTRGTHERTLHPPAPLRDARVLRTLILLDLESHPPPAGIDAVEIELGVVPGRIAQGSLLAHTLPTPETLTTLLARLGALMGESRIGAPSLVDSHDARALAMTPFAPQPRHARGAPSVSSGGPCLRRLRMPIAASVATDHGAPARVAASTRGVPSGPVTARAGPWRSSGRWWALDRTSWDRDEWDVELDAGACLCLARDRATGRWEVAGIFD